MNSPFDNAGDDSRTSVEPLDELLRLLAADRSHFDNREGSRLTASEPIPVPLPGRPQPPPSLPPPGVAHPLRGGEQPYRPASRPPVPLVTVLDDGAAMTGETVRIREPLCLIGRNDGTITIPHDPLVSARHAELVRQGFHRPYTWHLRDAGSTNGTFVCCKKAPLRPDRIIILGSRRFRPHLPGAGLSSIAAEHTLPVSAAAGLSGWPMLVETTVPVNPLCIRLVGSRLSVGRPGFGNQIELDDPLLANVHAVITQTDDGTWWIQATPSRNGVWVQVRSVELTESCRFQCGEQRFLFVLP
jgi:hypothetical protein